MQHHSIQAQPSGLFYLTGHAFNMEKCLMFKGTLSGTVPLWFLSFVFW